ncbi:protein SPT2 homolog [Macaca nemestrina]|uniref:protein SPT2 homolog n=1 Tax=Macaca nemestrina TaxID=9545 RepID=UPI0039B851F0
MDGGARGRRSPWQPRGPHGNAEARRAGVGPAQHLPPPPLGGVGGAEASGLGRPRGAGGVGHFSPALRLGAGRGVPSGRPGGARPGRGFHPGGVWTRPRRRVAKVRSAERSTSQIRKITRNRATTHGSKRPQTENASPGAHSLLRPSSQMGKLRKRPQTENASPSTHSLLRPGPPHFTDGETEAEQGAVQMAFARRSSSCGRGPPGAGESRSRLISEAGTRTPEQGLPGLPWAPGGKQRCSGKRNVAVHTLEHNSAVNRSEALTQATAQMHLEDVTLSERRQTHKAMQCVIPCLWNVQDLLIQRQEGDWLPGGRGREWEGTRNGDRACFGGDESVLKLR